MKSLLAWVLTSIKKEKKNDLGSNGVLVQRILILMRACHGANSLSMEAIKLCAKSLNLEVLRVINKAILML